MFSDGVGGHAAAARSAATVAQADSESCDEEDAAGQDGGMGDVNVDGMLANQGFKKGDVIMRVNEMPKRKQPMIPPSIKLHYGVGGYLLHS